MKGTNLVLGYLSVIAASVVWVVELLDKLLPSNKLENLPFYVLFLVPLGIVSAAVVLVQNDFSFARKLAKYGLYMNLATIATSIIFALVIFLFFFSPH